MLFHRRLVCSFCGKTAAQVSKLVAGRRAYICDSCATEAHRIMSGDGAGSSSRSTPSRSIWSRVTAQLRSWLPRDRTFSLCESAAVVSEARPLNCKESSPC